MRFVCPKDVKKMLLQQTRSPCWKKWVAKHECAELKEVMWLERKKTNEEWTEKSIETLPENWFWKEAGCREDPSTLVGRMKVNAKNVARRKAQKSTVKNVHFCFQTFSMKCGHHGNDVKATDENDFLSCSMMILSPARFKLSLWIQTLTLSCTMSVSLQVEGE